MKKLYIILALLLSQLGVIHAQTYAVLQLPFISRFTYDMDSYGLPYDMPFRIADGGYASILAVPYEGITPGYDVSTIIPTVNQMLSSQLGSLVECIEVTGTNTSNPAASKGLIYFLFTANPYQTVIELRTNQDMTLLVQFPAGALPPDMVKYGLDSYNSGANTMFTITGPQLPFGHTFTLRKAISGQSAHTWPVAYTFTSGISFDPSSLPSGVIPVSSSLLTEGEYVLYNDMYGVIASNTVAFVPGSLPQYEWLDKPGESSTVRAYTLNKNGETYTTTAYVPLTSDISVLRSILNGSTYTSGAISFSLVGEVRRAGDIALTFEVRCEPNTGYSQRTLNTGFSDRILPGIPNRFIQPNGGAYEPTVEIGTEDITVHYSRNGTAYFLMDVIYNYIYDSRNGNGGDIVFTGPIGLFYVAEYNGSAITPISKKINMNAYPFFFWYPHLAYESSAVDFGPDNVTRTIVFRKEIDFHIATLQEAIADLNMYMEQDRKIIYEYVGMTENTCTLRITTPINCTATDYAFSSALLFGPDEIPLTINIKAGGTVQTYATTGSWNDASHTSFKVSLDGSQDGLGYSLVKVSQFPTTPVVNTVVATIVGTGAPVAFENVTQKGVYKVIVQTTGNNQVDMSGTANMYDNSDMVVAKSNYIRTKRYTNDSGTRYNENAVHYDGLGREVQSVSVGAGGNGNDIIQIVEYDNMGRSDTKSYMPYTRPSLGYQMSALANSEQSTYYSTKFAGDADRSYPYGQKRYEYTAATDKVVQSTPGYNTYMYMRPFHTLARAVRADENVKKLLMAGDNRSLRYAGNYAAGAITAKDSWQEMGSAGTNVVSTEYFDVNGNMVAKRIKASDSDIKTTYYVYDNMGRQRYIVPPAEDLNGAGIYTPEQLRKYCFYTEYDKHGNVMSQYVPGAEPVYSVYDRRNRLVMSQSGNQRADGKNEWTFVKYDAFDRPVYNGTYEGGTLESHRTAAAAANNIIHEKRGGNIHGYTSASYPTDIDPNKVLSVNYYDDYSWVTDGRYLFYTADKLSADPSSAVAGLATGGKTKVLGVNQTQWLTTVTYYDKDYRTIQSVADLYPQGMEIVSNEHDFTGAVTRTKVKQVIGAQSYEYNKWFTYDAAGRLLHVDQQITGDAGNGKVRIASYTYDDMNQTATKAVHNALETTAYKYRMTGQLVSSISPSFSYALGFDRPADTGLESRTDGKLASVAWGAGNILDKAYNFIYDGAGQMLSANFAQKSGTAWSGQTKFAEKEITYDRNGNILTLDRTAEQAAGNQNIRYYYENASRGNVLTGVTVNGGAKLTFGYDADGNMVDDMMSQVGISYNTLNLPEKIFAKFGSTDTVRYIYSAAGEKLATIAANGSLTYYRSVFTYARHVGSSSEELLYVMHPEGIVAREGGNWGYKYFKTDHIGSTRVLLAARGGGLVEEQRTDYYPYGLAHGSLNNLHLNRYLYGGKEYQDAMINGSPLGLYDFHARYYNPILGRWFNMDPAMQTVNPYIYCGNSPMMYIDKDGKIFGFFIGFFRGLFTGKNPFKEAWKTGVNEYKIIGGLFTADKNKSFWGKLWEITSRLTWQFPQTIAGFTYAHISNYAGQVDKVDYWGGATVSSGRNWNSGAVTMSSYITGNRNLEANPDNPLFQHEYGHYLQSQASGLIYLWKYGLPSLYSAGGDKTHNRHPVEQDANARAMKYFEKTYPGFVDNGRWSFYQNPVTDWNHSKSYDSKVNQDALKRAKIKAYSKEDIVLFPTSILSFSYIYHLNYDWRY